jgi:hypothetical protein
MFLNSGYGVYDDSGFSYYDPRVAELITAYGRQALSKTTGYYLYKKNLKKKQKTLSKERDKTGLLQKNGLKILYVRI